jgi:hypothetical protein
LRGKPSKSKKALTLGRHLRTKQGVVERMSIVLEYRNVDRYVLNLSCEKAELLYAAFWTHGG